MYRSNIHKVLNTSTNRYTTLHQHRTVAFSMTSSTPAQPILIHHLQDSRSQRILWLCEELGVNYEIKRYERLNGLAPPELKAVHPLGKSPVITDGSVTLAESGAIVEYLIQKYGQGKFTPTTEELKLKNLFWTHYAEGSLMPPLVMTRVFQTMQHQSPWFIKPITNALVGKVNESYIHPTLKSAFDYCESEVSKVNGDFWLGSQLTSADFQMVFPLEAAASRASDIMGQNTLAYVKRIHARDAYKRGLERGGPYALAK